MSMPLHLRLAKGGFGSIRLMFVSWLFKVGGILFGMITIMVLVALVLGVGIPNASGLERAAPLILGAMTIALFSAGQMMAHRRRRGAVLGLALTLYPFVFAPLTNASMDQLDIVVSGVIVILLLSVWRELTWRRNPATA
jgi:hypothetical protein